MSTLLRRDLVSGREEELYQGPPRVDLTAALSPDRRQLAVLSFVMGAGDEDRILRVIPVTGGKPREISRITPPGPGWSPLAWSADGSYLLFTRKMSADSPKLDLWRVSVDGGKLEKLDFQMTRINNICPHPDGKQFAFGSMAEQRPSKIWVIENLLSELKELNR